MKKFFYLVLIAVSLAATSCSALYRTVREPNVRFELNADNMELSEPVTGTATVTRVFFIDWEHLFNRKSADINSSILGGYVPDSVFGIFPSDGAYAVYDLLEKNPDYDFVVYPQFLTSTKDYIFWSTTEITVIARMGRLKK